MSSFERRKEMKTTAGVLFGLLVAFATPAQAGVIYNLQATNFNAFLPSTLFTNSITGYVVVPDNIGAGGSIGLSLLSGAFNIGGYQFTLADLATGSDFNGRIATDGQSISFLSSGYTLKSTVAGCANGCYGSFDIAQNQQSNLLVFGGDQIGGIQYDTAFVRAAADIPEPLTLSLFGMGLAGAMALRWRKKSQV
jgi:hypothetical protein